MIIKRIYHIIRSRIEILPFIFIRFRFHLIGVTGTDGKTTTSTLIYNMLKNDGKKVALITTVGVFIDGKKMEDTGLHTTTPSAFVIHKILKKVKDFDFVVLETSSHAIDQRRIVGLLYDTIVYTNITHEHLDYHKTWERYATVKLSLQKYLKPHGFVILNVDDKKSFEFLYPKIKKDFNIFTYGIYSDADFRAVNITKNSFDVKSKYLSFDVESDLVGEYNISNSLAAISALYSFDISLKSILKTLKYFPSIDGRFDIISDDPFVIVDFAHTPNAIFNVLGTILKLKSENSRIITVFGAPGRRDHTKRPLMGKSASDYSDIIIITADDPRGENMDNIFSDISNGIDRKKFRKDINFFKIDDRLDAIKKALSLYNKGDIIALLGKGHEKSNAILGKEVPWSDKDITLNLIKKLKS